ncbi:hypothetical protein GWI33_000140 [Rhynchophorus ferrugineus]|uniref:Uncharacterized protein n=1 Tax=Rhynchophorus ferrugineus TaxID=354439 RepID=A0A834J3V8_RHYFE|nr:hypothetical protein GWI33_000140 [Rhynchophorus ferrugineus]
MAGPLRPTGNLSASLRRTGPFHSRRWSGTLPVNHVSIESHLYRSAKKDISIFAGDISLILIISGPFRPSDPDDDVERWRTFVVIWDQLGSAYPYARFPTIRFFRWSIPTDCLSVKVHLGGRPTPEGHPRLGGNNAD